MEDYLFDTPIWLLIVLGGAGLLFLWAGFFRSERKDKLLGGVGIALLLIGGTLFVLSRVVETDKEQVVRRSRELVAALEAKDWPTLTEHLTPTAEVIHDGQAICTGREDILEKAKYYMNLAGSPTLKVSKVEPHPTTGNTYTTEVSVYVQTEKGPQLVVTDVTWKRDGKIWSAQEINVKQMGVQPGAK